jgi:anti-sigma regulatory factor (Ser/Thr protein kinase)
MTKDMENASLKIYLNPIFTTLTTSFVEESAKAFGLGQADALKLTLACEEIFTYLCRIGMADKPVLIEAANGVYFVELKILFDVAPFDPVAFNLTAHISLDDESGLEDMGLLIASRSVERFSFFHDPKEGTGIILIKEKTYPEITDSKRSEVKPLKKFTIKTPGPEVLKLFAHQIVSFYSGYPYPPDFSFPGKLVDMVASGEYNVLLAVDDSGTIGGGIIWWSQHIDRRRTVECFGPYLFNQLPESGMAESLADALIGIVAKTDMVCLINVYATPELPKQYFEPLGLIDYYKSDGTIMPWQCYYRFLREDVGCQVWANPDLEQFLQEQYRSLSFARKITLVKYGGEARSPHSVFITHFIRTRHMAVLRPVWDGADASKNLEKHILTLKNEGIRSILFEIDTGHAWQANLTPILLENGFTPRLILPYAGKADVVIFQYREGM